jgi:hypothetical protein
MAQENITEMSMTYKRRTLKRSVEDCGTCLVEDASHQLRKNFVFQLSFSCEDKSLI